MDLATPKSQADPDTFIAKRRSSSCKFESLLQFLNDVENGLPTNDDGSQSDKNTTCPRLGLADISNTSQASHEQTSEKFISAETKKLQNQPCSSDDKVTLKEESAIRRNKRYIWDEDWNFQGKNEDQGGNKIYDHDSSQTAGDENKAEKLSAARQQLLSLKAASEEIQMHAVKLKEDQKKLKDEVEHLHSIRIEREANHVKTMKQLKKDFKDRKAQIEADHQQVANKQKKHNDELVAVCQKLEEKEVRLGINIEKIIASEKETCERIYNEGAADLQQAKRSWQKADENDLKRREQKISSKLKKDAAKAVEPKLKQLMEMNAEELARLQRQAAREIECYKLELFSKMNKEFKNQANAIRETERQRAEQVQRDWLSKVEEVRRHHCAEMEKTTKEHKQWMRMQKQQHEIDKERIIHKHETDMKDAEAAHKTRMEQVTMQHERDLASLEIEHNDQVRNRKEEIKREFNQWKQTREQELLQIEEKKLNQAEIDLRQKIQTDLDLVTRKLNEEAREKRQQVALETSEKVRSIKAVHQRKLDSIQSELDQVNVSGAALLSREQEASSNLADLRKKIAMFKKSIHEKEDEIALKNKAFELLSDEYEQTIVEKKREGNRKVSLAKRQLTYVENELDDLIASHPKHMEQRKSELILLKTQYKTELDLVKERVAAMLERKTAAVQDASSKLTSIQTNIAEIERQIDEARSKMILGRNTLK